MSGTTSCGFHDSREAGLLSAPESLGPSTLLSDVLSCTKACLHMPGGIALVTLLTVPVRVISCRMLPQPWVAQPGGGFSGLSHLELQGPGRGTSSVQ